MCRGKKDCMVSGKVMHVAELSAFVMKDKKGF